LRLTRRKWQIAGHALPPALRTKPLSVMLLGVRAKPTPAALR